MWPSPGESSDTHILHITQTDERLETENARAI